MAQNGDKYLTDLRSRALEWVPYCTEEDYWDEENLRHLQKEMYLRDDKTTSGVMCRYSNMYKDYLQKDFSGT